MIFLRELQIVIATVVPVLLAASFGCNRGPEIVPVAGKVTIDGQPLQRGAITVYQSGFRPATAKIESDGSFVFKTLNDRDGCLLGEHPVTVMSNEALSATRTKFFVPQRYANLATSDVKIKVDGATDQLLINLTWEGSGQNGPYIAGVAGNSDDR
jgi:hypothetical protein